MDNRPINTEKERADALENLDDAIKHVARVRRGMIVLFDMKAEEVDAEINKMCEKHYKTFSNMGKRDILLESLMDLIKRIPEKIKEVLRGGAK